jgi:hypothetical protein
MTGIPAIAPAVRPAETPSRPPAADRAAPNAPAERPVRPALAGPPLGRDEIEPMPAEMTFGDFLRALNPLHHIPVVGWVYRQITGETIQPVFRVLGGLVTGGPIGAIASAVGALAEELLVGADTGGAPAGSGTAVAQATPGAATPATTPASPTPAAATPAAAPAPGSLAAIVTASGQPLQPLPLATRLAARAYPTPPTPMREAAPPADPAAGFVPAATAGAPLPAPPTGAVPLAEAERVGAAEGSAMAEPQALPAPGPASRVRRAPVVPVTSGGQDPAFVQQMMRGLEAYERSMRARTAPQPMPAAAAP